MRVNRFNGALLSTLVIALIVGLAIQLLSPSPVHAALPSHDPIYIHGNEGFTKPDPVNGGGTGTENDPYIIENWIISAENADGEGYAGIFIMDTDAYFVIRNCVVENGKISYCDGIELIYAYNGKLENCLFENNYEGINLSDSHIVLNTNTCKNNTFGILLSHFQSNSENVKMRNNILSSNQYNFSVFIDSISECDHDIDNSNLVNGKPIQYLSGYSNEVIGYSQEIGYLGLFNCDNICVENIELGNNGEGIQLAFTKNSRVENCTFENNDKGIFQCYSENNILENNACDNNGWGIHLLNSENNVLSSNACENCTYGVLLSYSKNTKLRNNAISNNRFNFGVEGGGNSDYLHDIDASNLVNGKPIRYLVENTNEVVGSYIDIGYLALVSCDNILVENLVLGNNREGIQLAFTKNSRVENCTFENNLFGVLQNFSENNALVNNSWSGNSLIAVGLWDSDHNAVSNNIVTNNNIGIYLEDSPNNTLDANTCISSNSGIILLSSSGNTLFNNACENNRYRGIYIIGSENNVISNNMCSNSSYGIFISFSNNNTLVNNTCENNDCGILLEYSSDNNRIYHNSFINNENQAIDYCSNYWDDGYPLGGNYWSDYTGADNYRGENRDILGSDGIGDTPYTISGGSNKDRYPLMSSITNGLDSRPPIYIDGNNNFALVNGIVGGSGIENDPYIIENWSINAENANGIWIRNTTAYFVIRNCYLANTQVLTGWETYCGIYFDNVINGIVDNNLVENNFNAIWLDYSGNNLVSNNTFKKNGYGIGLDYDSDNNVISNNIVENNSYDGIVIGGSDNNVISNNIVKNKGWGIVLYNSASNTLITNTCENNGSEGIDFNYSSNNILTNNTCENNGDDGIRFYSSSNNTLTNNTCSYNPWSGIGLWGSSNNNTLTNNTCVNNHREGISIGSSFSNTLTNNTCLNNSVYGIYLEGGSGNNRIYHNNIINNGYQAHDDGINYWDNGYPSGGNYWSDYTGADNYWGDNQNIFGSDGIGDTPYDIPGGSNQDRYPLMGLFARLVITPRTISSRPLVEGVLINDNTPTVSISISDNVLGIENAPFDSADNSGYSVQLQNEDGVPIDNLINATPSARNMPIISFENTYTTELADGTYRIYIVAGDNLQMDNLVITFVIDTTPPAAPNPSATTSQNPLAPDIRKNTTVSLGGTAEPGATIRIWIMPEPFTSEMNVDNVLASTDGTWTASIILVQGVTAGIRVCQVDTAGNESTKTLYGYVKVDVSAPLVVITSPTTGTKTDNLTITVSGTVTKDAWESWTDITLRVQSGIAYILVPVSNGNFIVYVPLFVGLNTIMTTATDQVGNFSSANITVECTAGQQPGLTQHTPISIKGNDNFTSTNGVTSGHGTEDDPYIIENWDISAETANGIEVENTTAYFVIRNCFVYDGGINYDGNYGINFENVINGKVDNNLLENNSIGICLLDYSKNNILSNNICEKNGHGINVGLGNFDTLVNNVCRFNDGDGIAVNISHNNTICYNICEKNDDSGIDFDNSHNSNVTNNTCENNGHEGIWLYKSENNNLANNTCVNNMYGILLSNISPNNSLVNNKCINNTIYGIVLYDSDNNLISGNVVENNLRGICLSGSNYNRVNHNNIINNGIQALGVGTNYWDNGYPSGGNYWNDYTGVDSYHGENQNIPGSDGIGDTPYDISGEANQDHYPLIMRGILVSIAPSSQENENGKTLAYTVTFMNTGNVEENFQLTKGDNAGWTLSLDNTWILVPNGENRTTKLNVNIPANATGDAWDNIWVQATSRDNAAISDNKSCLAHAKLAVVLRGVTISVSPTETSAGPGGNAAFSITVTNIGNAADNYSLTVSDNSGWGPTLSEYSLLNVENGVSRMVTLTVPIPASAENHAQDRITITARSQTDNAIENNTTCTATATKVPAPSGGVSPIVYIGVAVIIVAIIGAVLILKVL